MRDRPSFTFEITGGDLGLDFPNTRVRRPTPQPVEHLHTYDDLVSWGVQAGAIPANEAARLRALAARRPRAARAALARAIELRETLFAIFSAAASGLPTPESALAHMNRALPDALRHLQLVGGAEGVSWAWTDEPRLDRILWPVIRAAALLLTSKDGERVRECAARDCDWLFVDTSRNGTRRWCDMSVCGNREKARRFQHRARRRAGGGRGGSRSRIHGGHGPR